MFTAFIQLIFNCLMCGMKVIFTFSIITKNLCSVFTGMSTPLRWLRCTPGSGQMARCLEKNNIDVLFSGLTLNLLSSAHFYSLLQHNCICRSHMDKLHDFKLIWTTFTQTVQEIERGNVFPSVFLLVIKRVQLNTPPCGTPFSCVNSQDSVAPIFTRNVLSNFLSCGARCHIHQKIFGHAICHIARWCHMPFEGLKTRTGSVVCVHRHLLCMILFVLIGLQWIGLTETPPGGCQESFFFFLNSQ